MRNIELDAVVAKNTDSSAVAEKLLKMYPYHGSEDADIQFFIATNRRLPKYTRRLASDKIAPHSKKMRELKERRREEDFASAKSDKITLAKAQELFEKYKECKNKKIMFALSTNHMLPLFIRKEAADKI